MIDLRQHPTLLSYISSFDRRLCLPWTGLVSLGLCPKKLYDIYESQKTQLLVAKEMERTFNADFTGIMDDGIICSETLGLTIKQFDYDFPAVADHAIKSREKLAALSVPDPLAGSRMTTNIESIRALVKASDKPVALSVEGPFTLAAQLAGVEDLARFIITDPDFVKELLAFTAKTVRAYAHAAANAGAALISIAEPTAIILSKAQFKTFVVPGVHSVFKGIHAWPVMHICGDTSHLLDEILTCPLQGISLDQVMDIPSLMPQIPEDIVVFGNIDPIDVMLEMDARDVVGETRGLLEAVAGYPNFLMSTGCDLVLETPRENLTALIETTRSFRHDRNASPLKKGLACSSGTRFQTDTQPPDPHTPAISVDSVLAPDNTLLDQIRNAVVKFQPVLCKTLCRQAMDDGVGAVRTVENGLSAGMEAAGELFSSDIYFIPELLRCADTLYAGLEVVTPFLAAEADPLKTPASLLIGVVQGDIHEIGKNLVIAMFTAAGWQVRDLGTDVSPAQFVAAYREYRPTLVGISALMSTSMRNIPKVVDALKEIDPRVKIMVGGAPVDENRAIRYGAHGWAPNAVKAAMAAEALVRGA